MPRILACGLDLERYGSIAAWMSEKGFELVRCPGDELLEQAVRRTPDVVLFGITDDPEADSRTLHVLRRMLPEVPLIFLADGITLGQRRVLQDFRPTFWAVAPTDEIELREAIASVLRGRAPGKWSPSPARPHGEKKP